MNPEPLVSIIVAIFNAASTLRNCVESLRKQTYNNLEIILIDDGSYDESYAICKEYALLDSRIKTIHHANSGVSFTRQRGLDIATGKYITYADADDFVESETLSQIVNKAEEENCDLVIFDYIADVYAKRIRLSQQPESLEHYVVFDNLLTILHGSCCNKLIRLETIRKNEISFLPGVSDCEDLYFNLCLCKCNIKISYLPVAHYHYVLTSNPNSATSKVDDIRIKGYELILENIKSWKNKYFRESAFSFFLSKTLIYSMQYRLYEPAIFKKKWGNYAMLLWRYRRLSFATRMELILSCWGMSNIAFFFFRFRTAVHNLLKSHE